MATILLDIYPATGHLNAVIGIAHALREREHRVVFIGPTSIAQFVLSFGFEFYVISPFIFKMNGQELRKRGIVGYCWEGILEYFTQQRYREVMEGFTRYDQLLEKIRPDMVILDEHFLGKAIYYQLRKVKLMTVQTTVATERSPHVPPFQTPYVPPPNRFGEIFTQSLWFFHRLRKLSKLTYYRLLSAGNDYFSLQKGVARKFGLSIKGNICHNQSYSFRFKNIPCLITPPRSFDFPRPSVPNLIWINALVRPTREDIADRRYQRVISYLTDNTYRKAYDKLIYCSLGSITNLNLSNAQIFFQKMIKVCAANPQHQFIMCVGKFSDVSQLLPTPSNLYLFSHVPQTDLLKHTDIMVTHGGVNSITECIYATVPMLVYPLFRTLDQSGNAARVVYHRLGVRGSLRRDRWQTISAKLQHLVNHWNDYQTNVQKLKNHCNRATDVDAITYIESVLVKQSTLFSIAA